MNRLAARLAVCRTDVIELEPEDATPRKYQRLAAGCLEIELVSRPPRFSIDSFEHVRNGVDVNRRRASFRRLVIMSGIEG